MSRSLGRVVVIGVGNRLRGDDGAGPLVARRLAGLPAARVVESSGEPAELLAALEGTDRAIIIDAADLGAPAGTVRRFDAAALPPTAGGAGASTHGLGLGEALALGAALGRLPPVCEVFAIQGGQYEAGAGLSPPVQAAVEHVAAAIRAALGPEASRA